MPRVLVGFVLAVLVGPAAGCAGRPAACASDADCPASTRCTKGTCVGDVGPPSGDAGDVVDAGVVADAGIVADAGVADAGVVDGGVISDAGVVDGGVVADAGVVDAGPAFELCVDLRAGERANSQRNVVDRCAASDPLFPVNRGDVAFACADPADPVRAAVDQALAGSHVQFHLDGIRDCAAVRATAVDRHDNPVLTPECSLDALITSNVAEGGACAQEWDCQAGLHCEAAAPGDALSCLAPASLGDHCLEDATPTVAGRLFARSCDADTFCNSAGQCATRPGPGAACAPSGTCAANLFCATGNVCEARVPVGAACSANDDCADDDAVCNSLDKCALRVDDGGACARGTTVCKAPCSVCRPATRGGPTACLDRGTAGAACAVLDDCRHGFACTGGVCVGAGGLDATCTASEPCADGLVCGAGGHCIAEPDVGDPCGSATTTSCRTGTCVRGACASGGVGEPCDADATCFPGLLCSAGAKTCEPAPTTGACSLDGACARGFACVSASCAPAAALKQPGQPCTTNAQCTGSCVDNVCATPGVSCMTSKDLLPYLVMLSVVAPLRRLRLRLR